MIYYKYIFYKVYMFFLRMNARDMPGLKATLLTGFILLINSVLVANLFADLLGYNISQVTGTLFAKLLLVGFQLGLWLVNYYLFWHNKKLSTMLQQFEYHDVPFNPLIATFATTVFFLLPAVLLLFNIIKGSHSYTISR